MVCRSRSEELLTSTIFRLCALLRAAVAGSSTKSTSLATMYQQSFVDRHSLYSSLKFALRQFGAMSQLVLAARGQSQGGSAAEKVKFRLFRACLLNLLSKFELALPCLNKMVVLPSLLPDEYLLRADYPGAKVRVSFSKLIKIFHRRLKRLNMR